MTPAAIGEILGQRDLRTITGVYMRATEKHQTEILGSVGDLLAESGKVADLDAKHREKKRGA